MSPEAFLVSSYWRVTFDNCHEHAMTEIIARKIEALARALAGTTHEAPCVTTSDLVRKYGEATAVWIHGKRTPGNLRALASTERGRAYMAANGIRY